MINRLSCPGPHENLTIKLLRYRKFGPGRFFQGIVPSPFRVGCPTPRQVMLHPEHIAARYATSRPASAVIEQPVPAVEAIEGVMSQRSELGNDWVAQTQAMWTQDVFARASATTTKSINSHDLSPSSTTHANSSLPTADGKGRLIDVLA